MSWSSWRRAGIVACGVGLACCGEFAAAQEKTAPKPAPKPNATIDPKEADADFALQGEYAGTVTEDGQSKKLGVQVIALGNGKFHAVGYHGGLPGDGWDKGKKVEADGELKDGAVVFAKDKARGILKDGRIVMETTEGAKLGTCEKVVRKSPTLGLAAPARAKVLFGGADQNDFKGSRVSPDGLLMEGANSEFKYQDAQIHIEFLLSYMPTARGQGRANSGIYLQGRYEVQMLDSFGLEGKNNECGGIYEIKDPDVNMCLPPLSWQTYDIDYTAAKFDAEGKKTADARITVKHNGVVVHQDVALPRPTRAAPGKEGPEPGPLYLQNHGNPIRYRNIWVAAKK